MDREKAIKILKECRERKLKYTFYTLDDYQAATDMAIKALEQEPDAIHNEREQAYMKGYEDASKKYRTEPCEDAISRQAIIRWVKTECNPYGKPTLDFESGKKVIKHLKQMPSVSTEKTGRWKKIKSGDKAFPEIIVCSRCGYENSYINEWNFNNEPLSKVFKTSRYCPNCGAKMEAEE